MAIRTLTFGDLESGTWGAAWDLGDGRGGFGLVGELSASLTDDWRLAGERVELAVATDGVRSELEDGFDELVTVQGRIADRAVQCLGRRGERPGLDPADYESIRDVSAWFAPDDGVALLAARPRRSRGHDAELLTVSAFETGRSLPIADPRLSTAYGADGSPSRAGLELWLDQPEDTEEETHHPPYRAAGEATGATATTATGLLAAEGSLFRWHWRGHDGAGVYLIVRPS
jgi:hypothetical protein